MKDKTKVVFPFWSHKSNNGRRCGRLMLTVSRKCADISRFVCNCHFFSPDPSTFGQDWGTILVHSSWKASGSSTICTAIHSRKIILPFQAVFLSTSTSAGHPVHPSLFIVVPHNAVRLYAQCFYPKNFCVKLLKATISRQILGDTLKEPDDPDLTSQEVISQRGWRQHQDWERFSSNH